MNLASDVNNTNFVGARNPDDILHVKFYIRSVRNDYQSSIAGRDIYTDVEYVEIMTPGNALNIIDTPAREEHKIRFPRQWAVFKNSQGDHEQVVGTPLTEWPAITRSRAEELKGKKFYTVDQIANASDLQVQHIGMDGYTMRQKAQAFLAQAKDSALAQKQAEELANKDAQIKALQDGQAQLMKMIEEMKASQNSSEPKKRKYTKRTQTESSTTHATVNLSEQKE